MVWELAVKKFCHNDRGSLLFTSNASKPHNFTEGRKIHRVFFNSTEHINHQLEDVDKQLQIESPLKTVLGVVKGELKKIREQNRDFYYRIWVVANTRQYNPHTKKNVQSTFCLWVFFAKRETDYIWTHGLGESTNDYQIYGCVDLYLNDHKHNLPLWPLYTRLILENQDNHCFVDEVYKQILKPIYNFDACDLPPLNTDLT